MKKVILIISLLLVSAMAYLAAGPFLTLRAIGSGLVEQDSDVLAATINFPALRQNFKQQINTQMMNKAASGLKDNPLNVLARGVATHMTDRLVDSLVTPAGLIGIIEGKNRMENALISPEEQAARKEKLFKNARMGYDSINRFSVWVRNERGGEVRLILARDGLSWQLVNLIAPLDR
jgi:hypothetical protein